MPNSAVEFCRRIRCPYSGTDRSSLEALEGPLVECKLLRPVDSTVSRTSSRWPHSSGAYILLERIVRLDCGACSLCVTVCV